jgi:LysR family carnitine catabolism transcriptional activator
MVNFNQLRVLVAVADTGSIRAAAERLNRTPSAVSMMLKQLEIAVKAPLFDGERKTRLTDCGRFVLDEARSLVEHSDRASRAIESFARNGEGRVDFACPPSVTLAFVPDAIREMRRQLPQVSIEIRDIDSRSITEAIMNGIIETGVAGDPGSTHGINFLPLFTEQLKLVCTKDDPLCAIARPIEWSDIRDRQFLGNGSYRSLSHPEFAINLAHQEIYVPNVTSLLALVRAKVGITVLPGLCMLQSGGELRFLGLTDPEARRVLGIITRKGATLSPAAQHFIGILRQIIASKASALGLEMVR